MSIPRKMMDLLSRRERLHLGLLFLAMLVTAILETVSIASVLPFLSVAADPGRIQANAWLSWGYNAAGFTSANGYLLALAGTALITLIFSNACIAATTWAQIRFALGRSHSLSVCLLRHYLAQPYVFFLRRNSADLGKNILAETDQVTALLIAGLRMVAKAMVALAIVVALVVFDPLLALVLTAMLGGAYTAIYQITRRKLARLGEERLSANRARYQCAAEAFGAIKDVKLLGNEASLLAWFTAPSRRFNQSQATALIIAELPRYALEALAFGGVLVIAMYLILHGNGLQQTVPALGLYAFAGYRLMPSLQQVFSGYAKLKFGAPALDNLHQELANKPIADGVPSAVQPASGRSQDSLSIRKELELADINFTYPGTHRPVLHGISVTIAANSTTGIVGPTGSGKTTLVDVILGLLSPQVGQIRVDGVALSEANLRTWQNSLGYVPQHIYLADDTIARNIAFGIPAKQIDQKAVERAAHIANIHDFITQELPGSYGALVGERGIRLSGGQRQRIGIARALYHNPSLLVLDEATSALDNDTEAAVMDAINELAGTRTILMITHRLSTLRVCDAVLSLRNGHLDWEDPSNRPIELIAVS